MDVCVTLIVVSIVINVISVNASNQYLLSAHYGSQRQILTGLAPWTTSNSTLPVPDTGKAVGYFNNSIFLIGGSYNSYQLTEYNIVTDSFPVAETLTITSPIYGAGQFYTQQNDILYMVGADGDYIYSFNLKSKSFGAWKLIENDGLGACLTSNEKYFFIVGGGCCGNYMNTFHVLDTETMKWLTNIPPMMDNRGFLSCIVHPTNNELFAIGGRNGSTQLRTIERITVGNDVMNNNWTYNEYNLFKPNSKSRAVVFGFDIIVVGGFNEEGKYNTYIDDIQTIDSRSGQVSISTYLLPLNDAMSAPAVITVNNILYVFGGYGGFGPGAGTGIWQYADLPPTMEPSAAPSELPSQSTIASSNTYISTTFLSTFYEDGKISNTSFVNIDGTFIVVIVIVSCLDVIFIGVCLYYIITKTRFRTKQHGNVSYIEAIKSLEKFQYIWIVLEIVDMVTDYLYGVSLIVSNVDVLFVLGWISLACAVCGLSIFFFKCSAYRKLFGFQVENYKKELLNCNVSKVPMIIEQIRYRTMDIDVISLLNGCIEDIPQTFIVLIATYNLEWDAISVLTITLSMLSLMLKLSQIVVTRLGCKDQAIPQNKTKKEMQTLHNMNTTSTINE